MIWFSEGSTQGTQALIYADDKSDMDEPLDEFGRLNHLKKGSKCLCLEDKSIKFMNSREEWV